MKKVLLVLVGITLLALGALPACGKDEVPTPDQLFLQGTFEQSTGLPLYGRSPYQQFLADQWRVEATEYLLLQRGLLGGLGEGNEEQTFQEHLAGREKCWYLMRGDFLGALTSMDTTTSTIMSPRSTSTPERKLCNYLWRVAPTYHT